MPDVLLDRRRERERLIASARVYAEDLSGRLPVVGAAVVGSVARGDFNVWSDIDVVVLCDHLPDRTPDRLAFLTDSAPPGVQPIGVTPVELREALRRGNPLFVELASVGVVLVGGEALRAAVEGR